MEFRSEAKNYIILILLKNKSYYYKIEKNNQNIYLTKFIINSNNFGMIPVNIAHTPAKIYNNNKPVAFSLVYIYIFK